MGKGGESRKETGAARFEQIVRWTAPEGFLIGILSADKIGRKDDLRIS